MEKKKIYIISLLLIGIVIITGTFAWLTWKSNETSLVLTIGDINNVQVVLKPYQISREIIPVLTYTSEEYTEVSVVNNSLKSKKVKLYYHVNNIDNELISSDFLYTIEKSTDGGNTYTEYLSGNFSSATDNSDLYIMDETIPKNTNYKYRVYIWLDGSSSGQGSIQGKKFSGELRAEILNDSVNNIKVDLDDGLIPITYDVSGSNIIVKTISSDDENWYDYNNKEWANAVLVKESGNNTREYYQNNVGVEVLEDDILAYYVYVPRYKYKIWTTELSSSGTEQEIEIDFENKDMAKSTGTQVGEYITHPAFTFGGNEVNGIWVGKFETGGTATEPLIKPNISSLRNQTVSEEFTTAQIFGTSIYGMTSNVDAHMMKNSEWGAVAYLSHSGYGVNREVYINNSSGYYTGRSGGNVGGSTAINTVYTSQTSTTQYNTYGFYTWDGYLLEYNTNTKSSTRDLTKVASTSGNITGIYDMSGGAFEYVMGVLADDNGNPRSGYDYDTSYNSGFNGVIYDSGNNTQYTSGVNFPNAKYYDLYTSISSLTACNGGICYGHGLSEVSKWYGDYAGFVNTVNPWFRRGGRYSNGAIAGAFSFTVSHGGVYDNVAARSALLLDSN